MKTDTINIKNTRPRVKVMTQVAQSNKSYNGTILRNRKVVVSKTMW